MRLAPLAFALACSSLASAQAAPKDDWSKQRAEVASSPEAEFIVRIGDIDHLNFGWPEGFDPFCGRMTEAHGWPWEPTTTDVPGLDRILLSSKYKSESNGGCGADGYSGSWDPKKTLPQPITLPTTILRDAKVKNAFLQLFIDDFQAPSLCSRFTVTLNGKRFVEAEILINSIDQTGPVGKLITIPIPEEFWSELTRAQPLTVLVDELKGAGDGFALDFARLLVNRKHESTCQGSFSGRVIEKETGQLVAKARVSLSDGRSVESDGDGRFRFENVPAGFEVVTASAKGFADGRASADVGAGSENPDVTIALEKGKPLMFGKQKLVLGEALNLRNILFDAGKSELKPVSKPELDKVVQFMTANPNAEIELSGHTSSEGEAQMNRSLSYRRVTACKEYVVSKGIDAGRIIAVGFGPDRPVASNANEAGRKQNRRVEMRIVKN